jgi:hypothetical protein
MKGACGTLSLCFFMLNRKRHWSKRAHRTLLLVDMAEVFGGRVLWSIAARTS